MFEALICPICLPLVRPLGREGNSLRCDQGHCFDISKRGYVNLLPVQHKRSKAPGDSEAMVKARLRFLNSGVYKAVAELLNQAIQQYAPQFDGVLLDAGCGDGYYLQEIERLFPAATLYGLDISKPAVDQASRRSKKIHWLVASNRLVPLQAQSLDFIVCAFGFPVYSVFAQLLKPGGKLLMLEAGVGHLLSLRQILYAELKYKADAVAATLVEAKAADFKCLEQLNLKQQGVLQQAQIADVLWMTPHAYRASAEARAEVLALQSLPLEIDVRLSVLASAETLK